MFSFLSTVFIRRIRKNLCQFRLLQERSVNHPGVHQRSNWLNSFRSLVMLQSIGTFRSLKLVIALGAVLALAACASDKATTGTGDMAGLGAGGVATPGSTQDFSTNVGDRVFFESDSSDLTPTSTATLDKQAQWLNQYASYKILIEGHADERGTREYNFGLGDRRAKAARDYLVSKGVSASRLSTKSWGKEKPVAVCDDISCWSQNRRAVTTLSGGN
jgi:peptidoglycan-associated lipoprotein